MFKFLPKLTLFTTISGHTLLLLGLASALPGVIIRQVSANETHVNESAKSLLFESKVRPLLASKCYPCHSSKLKVAQGGLTLDTKSGWERGGGRGAALIPGKPLESVLLKAVSYKGDIPAMPPAGKLSQPEIDALTEWVTQGAFDPRTTGKPAPPKRTIDLEKEGKHWSYQPLMTHFPPPRTLKKLSSGKYASLPQKPSIDRFILEKLNAKGLTPNAKADKRTLIRRAYFDLIGLPPNPAEVDSFLIDESPNAWEKVIDRLLASPQYGERWGRHWLDLARFAESHGYEQDYDRPNAYHYRDFVIRALNQDMPYNQFIQWQLAGDEFAPNNPMAMMATGFLAAGTHATQITKNQVEKERYDELDDMLSVTGVSMLGLTFGCARCHDHKYDPIPTREYYRMLSTFTTTVRSDSPIDFDPEGYRLKKEAYDRESLPKIQTLKTYEDTVISAKLEDWLKARRETASAEKNSLTGVAKWLVLEPAEAKSSGGATFVKQNDGSFLAIGTLPEHDTYTFTCPTELTRITAFRIEAITDRSLPKGGPGRAPNGNFALTDLKATLSSPKSPTPISIKLIHPRADFEQKGWPISAAIDSDSLSGWAVDPEFGKSHAAVFEFESPVDATGGKTLTFILKFDNNTGHSIGRIRFSLTNAQSPSEIAFNAPSQPEKIEGILNRFDARNAISVIEKQTLLKWFAIRDPEWNRLNRLALQREEATPKPDIRTVLISSEGVSAVRTHTQGGDFLEKTHVLRRGDPNNKGEVATQGFLTVLNHAQEGEKHWFLVPTAGSHTSYRRSSFANWITDDTKGAGQLLARVIVNRLWQRHFGKGIVSTPSDFGFQGERPTHPELLDWLAGELIGNGWRLKPIHKLMLSSNAYQESAVKNPLSEKVDSDNRFLWRHTRQRLEAEAVRDSLLEISGQLDKTMFGAGTLDENMKRRSLYFFIKRSRLIPSLMLFDAPNALQSIGARSTTTIAPQALLLLNSPYVRESAVNLAKHLSANKTPVENQLTVAYNSVLSRNPTPAEIKDWKLFLKAQEDSYLASGAKDATEKAWTDLCQTLFCLNEFIYVN